MQRIEYVIEQGDATTIRADVLAIKYARAFYGAAEAVARRLESAGVALSRMQPDVGDDALIPGSTAVQASQVLIAGVPALRDFSYRQIRAFSSHVITASLRSTPTARAIAMTLHGMGYGLDEVESCLAQFDGCVDALLDAGVAPEMNETLRVTIVERDAARVARLRGYLRDYALSGQARIKIVARDDGGFVVENLVTPAAQKPLNQPRSESERSHAFVAMPFGPQMLDVFYFGIQGPVRDAGLVCERMDHDAFTGDIMQWLKERIATASVVVADLTGANPNVYLEIGFAWGRDRPVILLSSETEDIPFDVRGHKRLNYSSIHDLHTKLGAELTALREAKRL